MKKFFLLLMLSGCVFPVYAKEFSVMDEAAMLGMMEGIAEACGEKPKKLEDFKLITARLIANKTDSHEEEVACYRRYASEKVLGMTRQKNNPKMPCKEVLYRFENMPLFKSVVYSDGSLKLSDGTFLKNKRPRTGKR